MFALVGLGDRCTKTAIRSTSIGAEPMLKAAPKARKRPTRAAKANAKRVEVRETYRDTMKRYSKTMALLAE